MSAVPDEFSRVHPPATQLEPTAQQLLASTPACLSLWRLHSLKLLLSNSLTKLQPA